MRRKRKYKRRRISNGVKKITQYLLDRNIAFKKEYRFTECRDKLPLPFDFAIFYDNKLVYLIEYNGQQHYKSVRRFGGKKALKIQQLHDLIKEEFCRVNKIPLLSISFEEEEKIKEILDCVFSKVQT
jgi:hypothetical protein